MRDENERLAKENEILKDLLSEWMYEMGSLMQHDYDWLCKKTRKILDVEDLRKQVAQVLMDEIMGAGEPDEYVYRIVDQILAIRGFKEGENK